MADNTNDRAVSLLYSGGCDSTLSASLLARQFQEIHLITFKHYFTWNVRRSKINAAKLQARFKDVKFRRVFLNSTALFLRLQKDIYKDWSGNRYLTFFACGACKLAMHTQLIVYNLLHDVPFASSGASHTMAMFPAQTRGGKEALEQFYKEHGITLLSPVYDLEDVDKTAVREGVFEERHLKTYHKAKGNKISDLMTPLKNIVDNIQGFCFWIAPVDPYKDGVAKKRTPEYISDISARYYERKIQDTCRRYISRRRERMDRKRTD